MTPSVRKVLTSLLRQQGLDDDGLHTLFCEGEVVLNDRPITELSDDPNDLEPLTPNHILPLPPGVFSSEEQHVRRRRRKVQYLAGLFWKRCYESTCLCFRNKKSRNLVPGDIVVFLDQSAPRGSWPLGKVLKVFPDRHGISERPITKLCFVPGV